MKIDKDTKLYGSFARTAGSFGCAIHNAAFQHYGLNCIYKSFSIGSIEPALMAMRFLKIQGAGISMPYKIDCISYVDEVTPEAKLIGAANTVVNDQGRLIAYNTDWIAAKTKLQNYSQDSMVILGNGGYAKAVAYAASTLGKKVEYIKRDCWNAIPSLKNKLVFNCTPAENIPLDSSNEFIDCLITAKSGQELSMIQAAEQFKLYTGLEFPFSIFGDQNGRP